MSSILSKGFSMSRRQVLAGSAAITSQLIVPSFTMAKEEKRMPKSRHKVDLERFVADCIEANKDADPQNAVREVLAEGVYDPTAMLAAVGDPRQAGLGVLHRSESLTIFSAVWTPLMNLMPHNHLMWALIGIYTGREDNIMWTQGTEGIEATGVAALFEGDVATLPTDVIHSVTNPLERFTGGIHIYGGDFFATTRSQWDADTMEEEPSDGDVIRGIFDRANERMKRLERS